MAIYRGYLQKKELGEAEIAELIAFAKEKGGIEYAYQAMQAHSEKAKQLILQMEDSAVKSALLVAIEYIVERKY